MLTERPQKEDSTVYAVLMIAVALLAGGLLLAQLGILFWQHPLILVSALYFYLARKCLGEEAKAWVDNVIVVAILVLIYVGLPLYGFYLIIEV